MITYVTHQRQATFSSSSCLNARLLAGRRLMLVEDAPDCERKLAQTLTNAGAELFLDCNAMSAADAILGAKEAPDAILMDLQNSIVEGHEAVRLLRRKGFENPIVAMICAGDQELQRWCLNGGYSAFIQRGSDPSEIVSLLNEITLSGNLAAR
ncbi:MAG: response regulator [Pirellulaceae bacterium]|nr:response regulator [Pirellulaceae bacterium]